MSVPANCSWSATCSGAAVQSGGGGATNSGPFNVVANANPGPSTLQGSCSVSSGGSSTSISVIVDPPATSGSSSASPASGSSNLASFLDPTGLTTGKPAGQSIFYRATDQQIHHIYSNTTWFTDDPGGFTGAQPAASGTSISTFLDPTGVTTGKPAGQAVFYVGTDQHIHHIYSNTTWFTDDPTALTHAILAVPGSPVSSFLDAGGITTGGTPGQAIFYIGTDQHVHHFFTDSTWHTDDPTANAGAPPAATGSGLCSFLDASGATTGGPGQAIFYIGTDQHVHHLYSNTAWHTDDPTAMTGAPLAASGSSLSCFLDPTGVTTGKPAGQSIFYVGVDQHVHHLYSNTSWHHDDPTAMTGAPLAATGTSLSSFIDPTGVTTGTPAGQSIFYLGTNGHVYHIYSNTAWHFDDPTGMTGAPPAAAGSPLSSFLDPTGVTTGKPAGQSIFYIGTNGHVYHIYSNTTWQADDPSAFTGATAATF